MDKSILAKAKIHLECNDGWDHLIEPLLIELLQLGGRALQIKEKFGGLRFYYSLNRETPEAKVFDQKVEAAENKSYETCEMCGQPGVLRRELSWIKTLCDEDLVKRQAEIAARDKEWA